MKQNNSLDHSLLDDYKIEVMHKVYRNVYSIMLALSVIITAFSSWDLQNKIIFGIGYFFVFSVFLLLLHLIKKSAIKIDLKYKYYVTFALSTYFIFIISMSDKHLTTVAPMIAGIFLLVFFTAQSKYIIGTGLLLSSLVIGAFIIEPNPTVELGIGYYLLYLLSIIFATVLSIRATRMIKWYEGKLLDERDIVFEKNIELTALNEEYFATQEELHHNYDEIVKLNQSEVLASQKMDALLSVTEDGIIDYNITDDVYYFSANAINHLGISPSDNFESIIERVSPTDQHAFKSAWMAVVEGKNHSLSLTIQYDHFQHYNFTFIHYTSSDQAHYLLAAIKDITLLKAHEENIFKLAYTDTLTGLYNRVGFIEALDYYIGTESNRFILALIDVDNFKYFNSIFGYDVGDKILKYIAIKLEELEFKYITRVGDDRFAFTIMEEAFFTDKIDTLIGNHEVQVDETLNLTLKYSIGVCYSEKGTSATELLKRAEIAMHEVKQNGKAHYRFYEDSFSEQVERRLLLSNALEHALIQNEIFLNYQPKYDSLTKEITSFEALVRWRSKEFGFVPPNVFIDIAEQSGYIRKLSDFIMYESCLFAKKINTGKKDYLVSINVSGKQLLDEHFAESFIKLLRETEVKAEHIGLEITETAVIENPELAVIELNKLHHYGITIYLDDFGTGYSSLNYLTQLPVDIIKIDKSFIDHISEDEHDLQLVKSIIQLAKGLNLKTVAEGVETKEQLALLELYGCDILQGYYFDKPLPESVALERIKSAL